MYLNFSSLSVACSHYDVICTSITTVADSKDKKTKFLNCTIMLQKNLNTC